MNINSHAPLLSISCADYQSILKTACILWKKRSDICLRGVVQIGSQTTVKLSLAILKTAPIEEIKQQCVMIKPKNFQKKVVYITFKTIRERFGLPEEYEMTSIFDQAFLESIFKEYACAYYCLNESCKELASFYPIQRLSFKDNLNYITWTRSVFHYLTFDQIVEKNLLGLIVSMPTQKKAFLDAALPYYKNKIVTPQLLSSLHAFPDDQWTHFKEQIFASLSKYFSEEELFEILLAAVQGDYSLLYPLPQLSESHFGCLIEYIKCMTPPHKTQQWMQMLPKLMKIPLNNIENVLSHTEILRKSFALETPIWKIIQLISEIASKKRTLTIIFLRLSKKQISAASLEDFLSETAMFLHNKNISNEQWLTLLKIFSDLLLKNNSYALYYHDFRCCFQCFAATRGTSLVSEQQTLVEQIKTYCTKSGKKPNQVINLIAYKWPDQSIYVLKLANCLIHSTNSYIQQLDFNKICLCTETNQPQTLLAFLVHNHFFDPKNGESPETVFEQALLFIEHISHSVTPGANHFTIMDALKCAMSVKKEFYHCFLTEVFPIAQKLSTNNLGKILSYFYQLRTSDFDSILKAIIRAKHPSRTRTALRFISIIKSFLDVNHLDENVLPLITAIYKISEDSWTDIIDSIQDLSRVLQNNRKLSDILTALTNIPNNSRKDVIDQISPLISLCETTSEMSQLFYIVSQLNKNECSTAIKEVLNLVKTPVPIPELCKILIMQLEKSKNREVFN